MSVLLSFRILSILYLRPETAVPLNVALVEGNETLHTSHLQCHIFVPLPSLPPSLPQHTTIYNGKRLLTVLHPAVSCFVFLSLARPAVGPPLVILCLCSVPSLPPSLPVPLLTPSASASQLTWSARPITSFLFPMPSLWKRDKPLIACIASSVQLTCALF